MEKILLWINLPLDIEWESQVRLKQTKKLVTFHTKEEKTTQKAKKMNLLPLTLVSQNNAG